MAATARDAARGPELVIGLVGAAGTDLKRVRESVTTALRGVGYSASHVRVSRLIQEVCDITPETVPRVQFEEGRLEVLQAAGDTLREETRQGDAVIWLAIARIRALRAGLTGSAMQPAERHAYIVDSLKHPSEVETLRRVYGDHFLLLSAYSPRPDRLVNLKRRIAKGHVSLREHDFGPTAERLIETDARRVGTDLGQNVRETFPLADVFVSVDGGIEDETERFINLLFGHPFITPTRDEHGMFHARAEALRSADLSRQVGAVIAGPQGNILASGCNEVPLAGGGTFWQGMPQDLDNRDFREGRDANAVIRYDIFKEFVGSLKGAGLLSSEASGREVEEVVDDLLFGPLKGAVGDIRARNLIEFGRVVHAEMHALAEAARFGRAVAGGTIYCTTFPCHMCARHLIAAGLKRVVFTEPYPKSMTAQLYAGSVHVEGDGAAGPEAVAFEPFHGVSHRLYMTLFTAPPRKDKRGYSIEWEPFTAQPKTVASAGSARYLFPEAAHMDRLESLDFDAIGRRIKDFCGETGHGDPEPA